MLGHSKLLPVALNLFCTLLTGFVAVLLNLATKGPCTVINAEQLSKSELEWDLCYVWIAAL